MWPSLQRNSTAAQEKIQSTNKDGCAHCCVTELLQLKWVGKECDTEQQRGTISTDCTCTHTHTHTHTHQTVIEPHITHMTLLLRVHLYIVIDCAVNSLGYTLAKSHALMNCTMGHAVPPKTSHASSHTEHVHSTHVYTRVQNKHYAIKIIINCISSEQPVNLQGSVEAQHMHCCHCLHVTCMAINYIHS